MNIRNTYGNDVACRRSFFRLYRVNKFESTHLFLYHQIQNSNSLMTYDNTQRIH